MSVAWLAWLVGLWLALAPPAERVDLAAAPWTRGATGAGQAEPDPAGAVALPFDARGVRWSTVFDAGAPTQARLGLVYDPGPDGMLFEILLDGQPLRPARDAWRPSPRPVTQDLGPAWLGQGEHLLEFVCREQVDAAALHLRALQVRRLPDG